ncbi:MAG: ferredoxin [Helicobacteraceae bacterium 4484_230]|nr:MAG: ferredoxin [Helicobacteraceae bacterium 4484_230]
MDQYNSRATIKNTSFLSTFTTKTPDGKTKLSYRTKRWVLIIAIHLTFFLSFAIDIQVLEGTLNGSRFLGFHLIDIFVTLETFIATHHLHVNMIIGTVTIFIVYLLIGGRTYCAWVCPYGLLSEIGEKIHNTLVNKKIIKERKFDNRVRYIFWAIFIILTFTSGYLVFETFNVVGILSRFIAYGWSVSLSWVLAVLLIEIFFSRRAWCRYLCPIGTTYGLIGPISATRVEWNDNCDHCMVCHDVCFENQVLELTKAKYHKENEDKGIKKKFVTGADCTLCGRCIDVCHADALKFEFRLKSLV